MTCPYRPRKPFLGAHRLTVRATLSRFTWYQVGLYDVRFSMDSVFERMAKAAQFLVMMGFAVVGPKFNPGEESGDEQPPEVATVPSLKYFVSAF